MKKINKKGFTLIELLAVVVILLAISVMAISSISAAMERNKAKQDNVKKEVIVSYAKLYYDSHKNTVAGRKCIGLSVLDLTDSEMTDSNGDYFTGAVLVNGNEFTYVESELCDGDIIE